LKFVLHCDKERNVVIEFWFGRGRGNLFLIYIYKFEIISVLECFEISKKRYYFDPE